MDELARQFDIKKAIAEYSDKKGYTEGVKYYLGVIMNESAIRKDEKYFAVCRKFDKAFKEFYKDDTRDNLEKVDAIFPEFFENGEVPELIETVGLHFALDGMSEYLMNLKKLYII